MIAAIPLISSALSSLAPGAASAATGAAAGAAGVAGPDFSQVLSKISSDAVQSMTGAENLAVQGLQGKADLQSVVQSVMGAQETLQTTLAIRDKSVAAFQEITRMSI